MSCSDSNSYGLCFRNVFIFFWLLSPSPTYTPQVWLWNGHLVTWYLILTAFLTSSLLSCPVSFQRLDGTMSDSFISAMPWEGTYLNWPRRMRISKILKFPLKSQISSALDSHAVCLCITVKTKDGRAVFCTLEGVDARISSWEPATVHMLALCS